MINRKNRSKFIISLDVETIWGYIRYPNHNVIKALMNDESYGRDSIDILLSIFSNYEIPATWAIVGQLFLNGIQYDNPFYGKLDSLKKELGSLYPGINNLDDRLYFGSDFIKKIKNNEVKHEIGYHTFTHAPLSECTLEEAKLELEMSKEIAKSWEVNFRSFVFPEHKIGHIELLKEYGFKIFRGSCASNTITGSFYNKPFSYFYKGPNLIYRKITPTPVEPIFKEGIWDIPGSMYFNYSSFPFLCLRAKRGLQKAIKSNKMFHIYLHPENILLQPNLPKELDNFLSVVSEKRDHGDLDIVTMGELASMLNKDPGI